MKETPGQSAEKNPGESENRSGFQGETDGCSGQDRAGSPRGGELGACPPRLVAVRMCVYVCKEPKQGRHQLKRQQAVQESLHPHNPGGARDGAHEDPA